MKKTQRPAPDHRQVIEQALTTYRRLVESGRIPKPATVPQADTPDCRR